MRLSLSSLSLVLIAMQVVIACETLSVHDTWAAGAAESTGKGTGSQQQSTDEVIDVTQAGLNKKLKEQAARELLLKQERIRQKALAEERARKAREAKARRDELEKQRVEEARKQAAEEARRQVEQAEREREEQERAAKEEAEHRAQQERAAAAKHEAEVLAAEVARAKHRKELEPLINEISIAGYFDGHPMFIFPDDPRNALVLPPGATHGRVKVASASGSHATVIVENEEFAIGKESQQANSLSAQLDDYIKGLQRKIKIEPYYGYYFGTVRFTVDARGQVRDITSRNYNENTERIIVNSGPYPNLLPFASSLTLEAELKERSLFPEIHVVAVELPGGETQIQRNAK